MTMFKPTKAKTVKEYIASLPAEKRKVVATVRTRFKRYVPKGYEEKISWGMITYQIPLKRYPNTYNGAPMMFASIGAQKNHYGLYLMCAYSDKQVTKAIQAAFDKAGKKLNMGKSCIRFKSLDDIPLEAIGKVISKISVAKYIKHYEATKK